jgi:hypothetical protein
MTLFEITDAVVHPDHAVAITWSDSVGGIVDHRPRRMFQAAAGR